MGVWGKGQGLSPLAPPPNIYATPLPPDPRSQGREFFHQAGVAPVQVVDPEDFGGARAASPAMTREALALQVRGHDRRALEMLRPRTIARLPVTVMSAPRRLSSLTCMKRFSKMVSVMTLAPLARDMRAMYWACMSVGKPG